MPITIDDLRRYAVSRNFFAPTTLARALEKMGFVQADPIRAPARAQDLILRQRVKNYRAGDLERLYDTLDIEEDFFINYGYVTRSLHELMHPRYDCQDYIDHGSSPSRRKRARLLLNFIRERGAVHPREVDAHFSHGKTTNYWGGSSNATTHLLDAMHYRGMLRVARREKGIRIYSAREARRSEEFRPTERGGRLASPSVKARFDKRERERRIDALVDVVMQIYAPLPGPSLSFYVRRLRYAAPQWTNDVKNGLERAKHRLSQVRIDGLDWYWPTSENPMIQPGMALGTLYHKLNEKVRLLAPFDPLVHDRARFELLWGWMYRFEAYTPVAKRKLGYYAMPLLWRDRVIGWANLSITNGKLMTDLGYVKSKPRERVFKSELEGELDRIRVFLGL